MTRNVYLDRWRGLAIVVMIWDHILIMTNETSWQRAITRIAAPIFFLISGHLVRRINVLRLTLVFMVGYFLGTRLSWIDGPNVLCIYAVGVPILVYAKRRQMTFWLLAIVPLTFFANGYWHVTGYYNPLALIGLMAIGSAITDIPKLALPLEKIGRFPLTIYVGHILILSVLFRRF